jgi:uncharacterized protein YndB with AHSA1/START domain
MRSAFSRETSVSIAIHAEASIIWALLTNASDYPRWNPTVISIEGKIAPGETIHLKSSLDPKRVFKLKVKKMDDAKELVWGDGMGQRIYTLAPSQNGVVNFKMTEKIGGPLFPLFAKMIPSFDEFFERFANSLKTEAEIIMNSK